MLQLVMTSHKNRNKCHYGNCQQTDHIRRGYQLEFIRRRQPVEGSARLHVNERWRSNAW